MATNGLAPAAPSTDVRKAAILVRFTAAPSFTTEQYDECLNRLEKSPIGRHDSCAARRSWPSGRPSTFLRSRSSRRRVPDGLLAPRQWLRQTEIVARPVRLVFLPAGRVQG